MRISFVMVVATALLALSGGGLSVASDASSDQPFLTGLRQRRLFHLAERYCAGRLEDPLLTERRRAELVEELSLLLTDWAVNSPPERREPLWQRARRITDDFAVRYPQSPRLIPVRYQGALSLLVRGELTRQEADVVADAAPLYEEAKKNLRLAIVMFRELSDLVQRELRRRSLPQRREVQRPEDGRLADYQLASLKTDLQYQLARALRNQGQCYDYGSPDRANSLSQALGLLDLLVRLELTHPLAWKSRLEEIVCRRLLDDHATARRRIQVLLTENPPPPVRLRARAERIRLALAANRPSDQPPSTAIAVLSDGRELDGVTSAHLDHAWLETFLEAWRVAQRSGDAEEAAKWQEAATGQIGLIQRFHGPYWTRRAEILLGGLVGSSPGSDLALQVRAAENAYRSGRILDAVAAYDRARSSAQQQGDDARAFELGFTAAAIVREQNRPEEALSRFRHLAIAMPEDPKAPEAHLVAVDRAAQNALERTPDGLRQYAELLDEHLATWPRADTADSVRWRLGRLKEYQQDWPGAIGAYRAISPSFPRFDSVVEAAARCYRAWLDGRKAAGEPTTQIAAEAALWFESLIFGPESRPPERWSPVARRAALGAARIWMDFVPVGFAESFDRAERILTIALDGVDNPPPQWQSSAMVLRVLALAGQGRRGEAADVIEQISQGPTDQLLEVLGDLAELTRAADAEVRTELAGLQLQSIELLRSRRDQLTPIQQKKFDHVWAQALAGVGRFDEAREAYRRLSAAYPRDGAIQESIAQLLLARSDQASLKAALLKWRELERRSPQGTDRWFRAKYTIARLHLRLGDKQQAEKIIRLLEILQPDLGGPKMKGQFLDLLRECRQ